MFLRPESVLSFCTSVAKRTYPRPLLLCFVSESVDISVVIATVMLYQR